VLAHGWTLSQTAWDDVAAELRDDVAAGELRLVRYDQRGHGRSTWGTTEPVSIDLLGADLGAVLEQTAPSGPVVLAGHSMGGMTIMEYAHRHSAEFTARVSGVVLMCTTAEGTTHTTYGLAPGVARVVRALEVAGAALLARSGPWRPHRPVMPVLSPGVRWLGFGRIADPAAVRLTLGMIGSARLATIGGFRPWIDEQHRVDSLVHMATVPAAVLVGAQDRLTPASCAETIVGALPHAEHVIFPDAGHMLPLECPDEVTGAIARVCQRANGVPIIPTQPGPEKAGRRGLRGRFRRRRRAEETDAA
jgi:pimeloyl-ACP methyl ester carboxylesterase